MSYRERIGHVAGIEPLESRCLFAATPSIYTQTNLVSNGAVPAVTIDPDLTNPWGVAFTSTGPFWVSDNGTGVATVYSGGGVKQPLTVNIPGVGGDGSAAAGAVNNTTSSFVIAANGRTAPAQFIFVGEDGGITGWNSSVSASNAIVARDDSGTGAVYKGATIARFRNRPTLFVTDFHNNRIAAFDGSFRPVTMNKNAFVDKKIPSGFAPFNVQAIGNQLFVTFAKQDADKHDDVAGPGNGYVDVFNTSGGLIRRLQHTDDLNSPWGVTLAPRTFGSFANRILVGQFGSGKIVGFNRGNGRQVGIVSGASGQPVVNDGLWSLRFGNGGQGGSTNVLFFSAGLNHEADGLFGRIQVASPTTT